MCTRVASDVQLDTGVCMAGGSGVHTHNDLNNQVKIRYPVFYHLSVEIMYVCTTYIHFLFIIYLHHPY